MPKLVIELFQVDGSLEFDEIPGTHMVTRKIKGNRASQVAEQKEETSQIKGEEYFDNDYHVTGSTMTTLLRLITMKDISFPIHS